MCDQTKVCVIVARDEVADEAGVAKMTAAGPACPNDCSRFRRDHGIYSMTTKKRPVCATHALSRLRTTNASTQWMPRYAVRSHFLLGRCVFDCVISPRSSSRVHASWSVFVTCQW